MHLLSAIPWGGPQAGVGTLCKNLLKVFISPLLYGDHLAKSCKLSPPIWGPLDWKLLISPSYVGINNNQSAAMMAMVKWIIPEKLYYLYFHRI